MSCSRTKLLLYSLLLAVSGSLAAAPVPVPTGDAPAEPARQARADVPAHLQLNVAQEMAWARMQALRAQKMVVAEFARPVEASATLAVAEQELELFETQRQVLQQYVMALRDFYKLLTSQQIEKYEALE